MECNICTMIPFCAKYTLFYQNPETAVNDSDVTDFSLRFVSHGPNVVRVPGKMSPEVFRCELEGEGVHFPDASGNILIRYPGGSHVSPRGAFSLAGTGIGRENSLKLQTSIAVIRKAVPYRAAMSSEFA